jgi:hypothetical protein
VSSFKQPSLLHVLSLSIFVEPYLCKSDNNDNIHQSSKIIFGDKDIHSLLGLVKEKVGDFLLNMCSIFQNNNCNNIPKCVVGCYMFIPEGHQSKWVPESSIVTTLTLGSQPRQGLAKVWAENETQKSHFMLLGV